MEPLAIAERCVIGSLFLSREAWPEVQRIMAREMFSDPRMGVLWTLMEEMDAAGVPIDEVTLPHELRQAGEFERIGGYEFLSECIMAPPTAANADYYAGIVRDEFLRREALRIGSELVRRTKEPEFTPAEALGGAATEIDMLGQLEAGHEPETLQAAASRVFADVLGGREAERGVSTGLPQLDRALGGLRKGNFIILAARTGIGKTSLAMNIVSHIALTLGQRVLCFSLEMSADEITGYLTASFGRVNLFAAAGRKLTDDEGAGLVDAAAKLSSRMLLMRCGGSQTLSGILAETKSVHARAPLALIVVDYIGLIQPDPSQRHENTQSRIAHASRSLKALALDLGVPILCLAQLNRDMDKQDRAPLLHDLRDSGSLEQDANVVMLLHRPLKNDALTPSPTTLSIAKARVMPRNTTIRLHFHGRNFRFTEAPFEEKESDE